NGIKHFDFASERYDIDPEDDEQLQEEKESSKLVLILGIGLVGILSFIMSKVIFTVVPAIVANFFNELVPNRTGQVALESLFKLILLLGYIYIISLTPLIKR